MKCIKCATEYTGKFCPECGTPATRMCPCCGIETEGKFCAQCGTPINEQSESPSTVVASSSLPLQQPAKIQPHFTGNSVAQESHALKCPKCLSSNLHPISDVEGKGASTWKICACGLCGLGGTGKTTTTHYWVCANCGNRFMM